MIPQPNPSSPRPALRPLLAALALAAVASLAFAAVSAQARVVHALQPSTSYPFAGLDEPDGLAIDQSSHAVYVLNKGDSAIDKFSLAGQAEQFSALHSSQFIVPAAPSGSLYQIAVDNSCSEHEPPLNGAECEAFDPSDGDIYVTNQATHSIDKFDPDGNPDPTTPEFGAAVLVKPTGVAVDGKGDVYAGNEGGWIEFGPTGAVKINERGYYGDTALGFGPADDLLYFAQGQDSEGRIWAFSGSEFVGTLAAGGVFYGLGINSSTGGLYYGSGFKIFGSGEVFGNGDFTGFPPVQGVGVHLGTYPLPQGIGIDPHGGVEPPGDVVYATDPGPSTVRVYKPTTIPNVATEPPSAVSYNTVTLNGDADPATAEFGAPIVSCRFEYVTEDVYKETEFTELEAGGGARPPFSSLSSGGGSPCLNAAGEEVGTEANPIEAEAPTALHAEISELPIQTPYVYRLVAASANQIPSQGATESFETLPAVEDVETGPAEEVEKGSATLTGSYHGEGADTSYFFEYVEASKYHPSTPNPYSEGQSTSAADNGTATGAQDVSFHLSGLHGATTYHYRFVAHNEHGYTYAPQDQEFTTSPAVTGLATEAATELTNVSATLHGSFEGDGNDTHYYFAYGTSTAYTHFAPLPPPGADNGAGAGPQHLAVPVEGLLPGITYHFRIFASNQYGATEGEDKTFTTYQAPTIEAVSSSHVTATSAVLEAKVNPEGFATTYRFSYGPTTAYGQIAPQPEGEISAGLAEGHSVKAPIEGLQPGVTYHFRLLVESKWDQGEPATSEDHSFEFFPPSCPNSAVRQQTGSAYLPDCRAYELVSPPNANATLLYPGGPNTGQATSPSRFAFTGNFNSLPGTNTIDTAGDLYLATRTDTGWSTRYIGLPGDQAGCMGGPPTAPTSDGTGSVSGIYLQDSVLTDPSMSHLLDFVDGNANGCTSNFTDAAAPLALPSNAPYLWSSEGADLGRLPTDLTAVPGAVEALSCSVSSADFYRAGACHGETTASGDLSRLFFSSNDMSFVEGTEAGEGLTEAPGSAYEDNLATGEVSLISRLASGAPIPQDPNFATVEAHGREEFFPGGAEEFLRFPAVSEDGSRVLISTATAATPVGCYANYGVQYPSPGTAPCLRFTDTPIHLYMRVGDAATYEIAEDPSSGEPTPVNFVGMTPDGSRVYFTSAEQLTAEETDGNTELYMWSAAKAEHDQEAITLVSKPNGGTDEATECHAANIQLVNEAERAPPGPHSGPWTQKCDAVPWSGYSWSLQSEARGGNGRSDSAIVENGDVYFYSPAQLDGDRGVLGQENLYDYLAAAGEVRYVATLPPEQRCTPGIPGRSDTNGQCSEGPVLRLEASPDDSHLAFLTGARLTPYDNAGHTELYSYDPIAETLTCDSCNPDGRPATANVEASQDGLFQTEDGRTFFSTTESLVPQDTDQGEDVYEYVDGRPQLITPGTGTGTATAGGLPGLVGVSANGTDVYFSTYDTLVSEDHNGDFLKFYDARTDGGFPQPTPAQPCEAAEECHGPGTEPPALPTQGTAATLAGGNATPESHPKHHKKKHKRAKAKRHKRHHRPVHRRAAR